MASTMEVVVCLPTCPYKAPPCIYCKKRSSLTKRDSREEFTRKVSEKIGNWLLDIPTYAKMSAEDKQKRIDMIEELANRLTDLKDDEDIETKAKKEVEKCLNKLPMWLPSNKSERDDFKALLTDNLMNQLTRVFQGTDKFDDEILKWIEDIRFKSRDSFDEIIDKNKIVDTFAEKIKALASDRPENDDDYHDALKKEVIDILNELPIDTVGDKSREIERLARKLITNIKSIPASEIKQREEHDKFSKEVFKWFDAIEFKRKDSQGNVVDREEVKEIVTERLKSLALERSPNNDDYHETLKNELIDILEGLPIELQGSKRKGIEKLASKLAYNLKDIPKSEIKSKRDKFDEKITQFLKGIKFKRKDSKGQMTDAQKFADIFAERLKPLIFNRPDDDDEHHEILKNEIYDILDELPLEVEGNKRKYLDKVAEKLTNVIKNIPANELKQEAVTDKFYNKITQWMKDIKFKRKNSQGDKVDKQKIMDTLQERLKYVALERPENDDEYYEALKNEIIDFLNDLPMEFDGNKDKLVEKLAAKLATSLKIIPAREIKPKEDKFDETITQWMRDIKFMRKGSQGEIIDKEKIAEIFKERLKLIAIERPENDEEYHELLKKEALDILEDLPIEIKGDKEKFIDKMTTKLAKSLKKIPTSELKPQVDKFDQKISQLMRDIKLKKKDSQGEIVDKKKVEELFSDRLKAIAIDRPEDNDEYHEALMNEVLDILDELPIEVEGDRSKFAEKIATKFANSLKNIPTSKIKPRMDKFDKKKSQWMKDIKLKEKDEKGKKVIKKDIANLFASRLKPLAKERVEDDDEFHEILKSEIKDILRELPIETGVNREKSIERLADKLVHTLKTIPTTEIKHVIPKSEAMRGKRTDKVPYTEEIWNWLDDIPGLSSSNQSEKKKMAESLANKLKSFKYKNSVDTKDFEDVIVKWLSDESQIKGIRLDSRTKEYLANQLTNSIFDTVLKQKDTIRERIAGKDKNIRGSSKQEYKEFCSKEIQGWLKNIPQLSGTKEEKIRLIDSLSKKLGDLSSEGVLDEDEIQDEIMDWLSIELNKKGIKIDAKTKDALVTQLAEKISKGQPPRRSSEEIKDEVVAAIWKRLRYISEITNSTDNREMVDQLAKRISTMRKKYGEKISDDNIREEIHNWTEKFMECSGIDLTHRDKLTNDLTSKLKLILKPNAKGNELKHTIKNEVSGIIDRSSQKFSPNAKKNVARRVSAKLAKNIINVGDDKQDQEELKSNIIRILDQETDLSEKEAKDLAELFINSAKMISAIEHRSTLKSDSPEEMRAFISDKVNNTISLLHIDNTEEIEEQLTELLVEQIINGIDPDITTEKIMGVLESANISKEDARDLTMRLALQAQDFSSIRRGSVLSRSTEFTLNEVFQTSALKEITDFMEEVKGNEMDAQTRRKMKIAAQKLSERLCDTISDPNQSLAEKEDTINNEVFKFLKNFDVPIQDNGNDLANRLRTIAATSTPRASMQGYSFCPRRTGFSIGSIYIPDELKKKINQNFVSDLEAAIEDWIFDLPVHIDDKALINHMARNLTSDIADRQTYLQSHPEVKLTEEEELEFLKYQVFRAMGKSLESEDLAAIMAHTPALLAVIRDVLAPVLSKSLPVIQEGEVINKLFDEISIWVEEISSELNEENYEIRQEKVKELAKRLHKLSKNKAINTDKLYIEIAKWVKPILKDKKNTNVQSIADRLKNRLQLKGIIKELYEEPSVSSDQLQQDTSQFVLENLSTGFMDWLKSSPLYQRRNTNDKLIQENIMQELAQNLKKVIQRANSDTNLDIEVLKEVKKHIEKFPMEPQLKSDKVFIDNTSAQLVDYLKNMQMFEGVSGRQSILPIEHLVSTVNDWIHSLPMNRKNLEKIEINDLKMDFIAQLSEMLKGPNEQDDQAIRQIIQQFLQKLPVDVKNANDPKFIDQKVDQLFKNILGTPFLAPTRRPTINRDLVQSAVQNWSEKLPLLPDMTPEEVSDRIHEFTTDISSVLEDTNASAVDNYKNTLLEKTTHFLKKLTLKPEALVPENLHKLAEDLVSTIKNKVADLSPKPIPNKNAADVLYDNITTWCEDLPLPEGRTPEEKERINTIKHNLASKLMNKVGELNMNPEILNDDALYEHLIQEEINDLLSSLPPSSEMDANIQSIKDNLMTKVKEAKQKTQDEFAAQTYKQQLRDTISKTLPFDADLSAQGEPFEVLVENLADAYINLNFITDSDEQKAAYKKKIADEITKYCDDYLTRHPQAPIDSSKLNQELFNALKSVPTPKEEIMRYEAVQVRMKDEINEWMKKVPLTSDSGPDALQKNKVVSILAKKMVEIEKEKEVNPYMDYEEKAHKEIAKLLKKLPIEPGHESEINDLIKNLVVQIQSSEQSRRISASTTRKSIDLVLKDYAESSTEPSSDDLICTCNRKIKIRPVCKKNICNFNPAIPPSTLSTEDRAHLERIRLRCKVHKICSCRDASVCPPPIDAASQTDVTPTMPNVCTRIPVSPRLSPCTPLPTCVPVPPCSGSEQEVSPQIIIKEYLWDSGTSKLLGPVYRLPCIEVDNSNSSVPSFQRPMQKSVSIQPSPCSFPERPSYSQRPCINVNRTPCPEDQLRPGINLGTSLCPSPYQISNLRPHSIERTTCLPPRPCSVSLGSSPCQSPLQIPTPCPPPLRPCINLGTSPRPSPIQIPQRSPCPTRPCTNLGRSPCSSPHQMSTPKPCITLPRPLISSHPSPYANRSLNTSPCPEDPYCSTPRRNISRDPNMPFRQPNFQPNSRSSSPMGSSRYLRPRVINVGDEATLNSCRRRNEDERISEYQESYRPQIYREPAQMYRDDKMRCCRCNHRIKNVCQRHRDQCPSTENLRHCSKCCGLPCPHPMGLFFR